MKTALSFEKLLDQWEIDCKLDSSDLAAETMRTAVMHAKYLRHITYAKLLKSARKDKYDKLRLKKWEYFNGRLTKTEMDELGWSYDPFNGGSKPMKNDMNAYLDTDKDLAELKAKLMMDQTTIELIEEIINTIRWRHSSIKNILESKKFDAGY